MRGDMKKAAFTNRELSWLEFNQRVLEQAQDARVPLLERLKFLAITSSNLDEFFMVRVGGLHVLHSQGVTRRDPAGLSPAEQLRRIGRRTRRMVAQQYDCYVEDLEPALALRGVNRVHPADLSDEQLRHLRSLFDAEILPVLSPLAVSAARFPLVLNRTLCMAVRLAPAAGRSRPRFAVIPIGRNMSRFITLRAGQGYHFVLLEDLIEVFAGSLFPGETVRECRAFRITRNADLSVREEIGDDLLVEMAAVLDARKRSDCVRLETDHGMSKALLGFLTRSLRVPDDYVYATRGPIDLSAFMSLTQLKGHENLKYEPWAPQTDPAADNAPGMFELLARQDLLMYHPYDSFEPVVRFVNEAADDPDVLAVKQILYRTSGDSPIVAALARAAQQGKYVTALVELKARFDEARNIAWARFLEDAGVQVIHGVKGLKTHAKLCLVIRRETRGVQRYMHFGTGNYNDATARLYGDIGYMTADEDLGADATAFFNAVTGYSQPREFLKLDAAPISLRERVLQLIDGEIERCREGQRAQIMAKVNSLADPQIIEALYRASQAGVRILLNVRGVCCLRPGVGGLSENIRVTSIVDRFLEHARVVYFLHGGEEKVFISSADWMPRNLDRRIELLIPVNEPRCRERLVGFLRTHMADNVNAWELAGRNVYCRLDPPKRGESVRSQEALYRDACERARQARQARRTVFEPHRPSTTQK